MNPLPEARSERQAVDSVVGVRLEPGVLDAFCRRHHIVRMSLFGSTLTGSDRADSDVDLLVEFAPGHTPGMLAIAAMEEELSDHIGGRSIDIRTRDDLSRYFRDEVIRQAALLYAR